MRYSFVFIFWFFGCLPLLSQVPDSAKYQSLDPYDFHLKYLREDSALLIDAREFFEYRRSRIHGSTLISPSKGFDAAADTLSRGISLFVYCYNGGRSARALEFFHDNGFRKLYNLEGGNCCLEERWVSV
ncbi:MAG: rhodanese-like domain-containing protein [Bacteroidota bacterium]